MPASPRSMFDSLLEVLRDTGTECDMVPSWRFLLVSSYHTGDAREYIDEDIDGQVSWRIALRTVTFHMPNGVEMVADEYVRWVRFETELNDQVDKHWIGRSYLDTHTDQPCLGVFVHRADEPVAGWDAWHCSNPFGVRNETVVEGLTYYWDDYTGTYASEDDVYDPSYYCEDDDQSASDA